MGFAQSTIFNLHVERRSEDPRTASWKRSKRTRHSRSGRLSSFRAERVEEHVLFCRTCQDRLQAESEYVVAMKRAAARTIKERDGGSDAASAGHPRIQRFGCHER